MQPPAADRQNRQNRPGRHQPSRTAGRRLAAQAPRPGRGPTGRPGQGPDSKASRPPGAPPRRHHLHHGQREPPDQPGRQDGSQADRRSLDRHPGRHYGETPHPPHHRRSPRLPRSGPPRRPPNGRDPRRATGDQDPPGRSPQRAPPSPRRLHQRRGRGDHRPDARARRGRHPAAAPAGHPGAERRRRDPRHRHRVPARPAGLRAPHPVRDQAARRRPAERSRGTVRPRIQVARRPDHADPRPRRPPPRPPRPSRTTPSRLARGPRAVPRLPGPAPHPRVQGAGRGHALAEVPHPDRPLAQGAGRGPRRRPTTQAKHRAPSHRRGASHQPDRPRLPPGRRARRCDYRSLKTGVPARPAQALQRSAVPAGVLLPALRTD